MKSRSDSQILTVIDGMLTSSHFLDSHGCVTGTTLPGSACEWEWMMLVEREWYGLVGVEEMEII